MILMGHFQRDIFYESIHRDYQCIFVFSLITLCNSEFRPKLCLITSGSDL